MDTGMASRAKMGPSFDFVAVSHAQFSMHTYGHLQDLQDRRAAGDHTPARRLAPFKRPSIRTCCKPADRANSVSGAVTD